MPASSTIAVSSPKKTALKQLKQKHSVSQKVLSNITRGADKKVLEAKKNVQSQILFRGIHKTISHLGNNPISILAKNSVKKGIQLKPQKGGVFKKSKTRKEVSKALNNEITKFVASGLSKPSEVKAKKTLAPIKVLINTEILKKAALSHIRSKAQAKSPSKVSKKTSSTKDSPSKAAAVDHKTAKAMKPASPVKGKEPSVPIKSSGRPKRSAKGKKNYSDE